MNTKACRDNTLDNIIDSLREEQKAMIERHQARVSEYEARKAELAKISDDIQAEMANDGFDDIRKELGL
jgi:hypothetical protein